MVMELRPSSLVAEWGTRSPTTPRSPVRDLLTSGAQGGALAPLRCNTPWLITEFAQGSARRQT